MTLPTQDELITEDGLRLQLKLYRAPEPKGTICLVHGFGEHSGRYLELIAANNQAGFHVLTYDQRGHGLSEGKRGYVHQFSLFLDDLAAVIDRAQQYCGDSLPLILFGHSMGGGIVLNFTLTHPKADQVQAVIATSPWLALTYPEPTYKVWGSHVLRRWLPSLTLRTGMDANGISRDPKAIAAYLADPLVHDKISAELFLGIHELAKHTYQLADQWSKPLLLAHGDADPITLFASSVSLASRIPRSLVTFKAWPDARHELHHELNAEKVIDDYMQWLSEQVSI